MSIEVWQQFLNAVPHDSPVRSVILESWQRSRAAGLARSGGGVNFRRVTHEDLDHRMQRSYELVSAAGPHLKWLSSTLAFVRHVVYVTDRDGVVLASAGDEELQSDFALTPGHDWSERTMGTNGAGTALATGRPVAVVGSEHFLAAFENCTCTAAPIRDNEGALIGALDISTSVADGSPERIALVGYAASMIERDLQHGVHLQASRDLDQRKDVFLAMLSHELRNPLAPIQNGAQYLSARLAHDDELNETCALIRRNVAHLARLLDDLLDVSRAVHGRIDLQMKVFDLCAIVGPALEAVKSAMDGRHQRLQVDLPAVELHVLGDASRLVQVLSNLLQNGSKFTPPGGSIHVALRKHERTAELNVTDTGRGMPQELLARIFEPFVQGGRPGIKGGLGLGLYLAKSLVELHDGTLTAFSDGADKGSRFVIRLPIVST